MSFRTAHLPPTFRAAAVSLAVLHTLLACAAEEASPEPPAVSIEDARAAAGDLHLIFQDAFLHAVSEGGPSAEPFDAPWQPGTRMRMRWSEDVNFADGTGRFELALNGYTIAPSSPYADGYNGYIASGLLVLDTNLSTTHFSEISIDLQHADREHFPVTRITANIPRGPNGLTPQRGFISVEGTVFRMDQLVPRAR